MVVFRDITERKRVEEALRESEEKFRTIVDTTSEWIWEIDADGRHTYSNPAVESLLGYTPDEFLGLSAFDFMHPEDRERIGAIFPSFVNEKKGWRNLVIRWRHRDGTYRYLESNAIPVFDERGGLAGFRGADRDITERMRTEEILRQANLVVENSPVVVFRWKAVEGWPVAYVSNNVTRFGYMPEELLLGTVPYAKIVHPDDLVRVADEVQKYSAEAVDQFRQEYRIVTRDGGVRWVDDRTVIERDSTGAITHYQGIIIDITERKAAEEALRESEEKYRTLVESTADMVWEVDRDGRYVYVSPVIRTLLGFEPGEVIGRTPFDLMAPDEAERVKRIFSEYAGSGKPIVRLENTNIQRDGHPVILETSGEPVFDASGNLTGYRGIDRDITERKRAEEALRQAHRQLTLMTGITRHDILNNITVMLGFLEVAKGKSSHPEMREFIDRLETKTGQIQSLIEFTRIYQDLGTQKPQWQDIHAVLSRLKVPPGISLAVTCAGTEVFADAMLERVFYNLVDNSVRHGEHVTGISVTRQETASGLVIVFTDNGAGIPADEKEKIFDRGYGRNSGLGLFLAREVLALTGITISETGAPGEGARFEISVPRGKYRFTGGQGR
jgi:PAS domain S-box-containing protein